MMSLETLYYCHGELYDEMSFMSVKEFLFRILKYKDNLQNRILVFIGFYVLSRNWNKVPPERFKTRAAYFPIWHDERTGMQWTTLGKTGSEAAPQLQGQ